MTGKFVFNRQYGIRMMSILFGFAMLLVGLCLCPGNAKAGDNLLENPGFELTQAGIPESWLAKDGWATGAVAGSQAAARSGSNGLELRTTSTNDFWVRQIVEVEAGATYELSGWMISAYTSNGKGQIKVEFYKDTTDSLGWKGQVFSGNLDSYDDWEHVKLEATIPEDANLAQVFFRMYGPGWAYYDDVSFEKLEYEPGVFVTTDEMFYYDTMTSGTVRGTIRPSDGIYGDKTVEVKLYPRDGGATVLHDTYLTATEQFHYVFDPRLMTVRLPYTLEVTLRSDQNEILEQGSVTIYRWERPTALREDGVLIVNGEPFLPRIGYHVPIEDYPYVDETINAVQGDTTKVSNAITEEQLDEAHANGLKVFFPLYPDVGNLEGPKGYSYVVDKVTTFKDHPAIIGWMLHDEPNKYLQIRPSILEDLAELYRIVRTIDSVHPTYMTVNDSALFDPFFKVTDIIVVDPYPLPNIPITYVSKHVTEAKALHPHKPVYSILQSFMLPGSPRWPYLPNITELRNMAYQSVLGGVHGLGYYSFTDPGWDLMDSVLYPGLVEFTDTEIPHLSGIILNGEKLQDFRNPAFQWGLWEMDDRFYAAAVNVTGVSQTVTIPIPSDAYSVEPIAPTMAPYNVLGNELILELPALGSALVKLTPYTATTGNLLTNGDFENTTSGIPAHWQVIGPSSMLSVNEAAYAGNFGMLVQTNTAGSTWVSQPIWVDEGTIYEINSRFKASSVVGNVGYKIEFYEGTNQSIRTNDNLVDGYAVYAEGPKLDGQWHELQHQLQAPAGSTYMYIYLRLFGTGTVYFDDASIAAYIEAS